MKNATMTESTTMIATGTANQSQRRRNQLPRPLRRFCMGVPSRGGASKVPPRYDDRVTRAAVGLVVILAVAPPSTAQTSRQIRVDVQFRQTGTQSRDAAGAPGGGVTTERRSG